MAAVLCAPAALRAAEPLRIGVAGVSHGHIHEVISKAHRGDFTVVGVWEANDSLRAATHLHDKVDGALFYADLDRMLDQTQPEAVVAFGPVYDHLQVVEACAPRGIHVMVEKPLAISVEHAHRIADLARRYGESIGRMASEMNVTGWYAPAMNGHRSAFDGRNFEYYSEDSVLAGYIGASSIAGAQSYGVYAYMKHFALNDQQINQSEMLCTWADEQAIREIYLRPFEISAKVGGCKAVMSSWNYIGNQWAGACNALLNGVLRGEWGFRGMVITDGFHFTDYMDSDIAIRNGCDLMLKNYDVATNHLTDTTSATSVKAMRQACKNIMYTVVNSRVYDPANTVSTPIWRTAMIVVNVLLAVLLVVLEVLTFKSYKKKKAQ